MKSLMHPLQVLHKVCQVRLAHQMTEQSRGIMRLACQKPWQENPQDRCQPILDGKMHNEYQSLLIPKWNHHVMQWVWEYESSLIMQREKSQNWQNPREKWSQSQSKR